MKIEIGDKEYNVEVARTEEEKIKGLQEKESLGENEGMLFIYDEPQELAFWMKDTAIPLDIVFIDEDGEVISVQQGQPYDETLLEEENLIIANKGSEDLIKDINKALAEFIKSDKYQELKTKWGA